MWKCLGCGIQVEDEFDVCWSCGTDVDGVEDPDFARDELEASDQESIASASGRLVTVASFTSSPQAHACKLRLAYEFGCRS